MKNGMERFEVEIDFENVLRALSAEIYSTPHAFLRENLQNAIDACRFRRYAKRLPQQTQHLGSILLSMAIPSRSTTAG